MDENTLLGFRNRAVSYFEPILVREGYDLQRASELAFFIAKILEDTLDLVEDVNTGNKNTDMVLEHIHSLYTNQHAFVEGRKVLMYKG